MERLGVNAAFNPERLSSTAEYSSRKGRRVDRKSFFAIAESRNGIDQFRFWDYPSGCRRMQTPM